MTQTAEPEFVAETLEWCNTKREQQGKKPLKKLPKGRRYDGLSCPCGKATGWEVQRFCAYPPGSTLGIQPESIPHGVQKFVIEFDEGRLPQYQEEK